jgi:hypothetical protein
VRPFYSISLRLLPPQLPPSNVRREDDPRPELLLATHPQLDATQVPVLDPIISNVQEDVVAAELASSLRLR